MFLDHHSAFTTFLTSILTPPLVMKALANGIHQWSVQASPQQLQHPYKYFLMTSASCKWYNKQTHLGWNIATFGLMDTSWSKLVPVQNGSPKSPRCSSHPPQQYGSNETPKDTNQTLQSPGKRTTNRNGKSTAWQSPICPHTINEN
jgi:hypothetical protein